ncbi:MAG: ferredoxin, partial [Bacillota bacterium]
MADAASKVSENVSGPYYVDETCIACEVCVGEAPENFKMTDDGDYAYVFKQPDNDEEKAQCDSALASCPVSAIGEDG